MPEPVKISVTALDFSERTNRYEQPLLRDQAFWNVELHDMRVAGIEDVLIARSMVQGRAHYHSAVFEEWSETDTVAMVMQAAAKVGMGVYLGLDLNLAFWDRSRVFPRMMARDLRRNQLVLEELLSVYGHHPALRGIYLSNEPDYDNLDTWERTEALRVFLHAMYQQVKAAVDLPVLSSPFFSKSLSPDDLAAWWDAFIDRPMFDVIAMQDGVGCRYREIDPEDIPPRYTRLAPVFAGKGIHFWNNIETFILESFTDPLTPAPFARIEQQYQAGQPYVERTFTWEYGHFLGRQQVGEERYREFVRWNLEEAHDTAE
ncbi:MAG: DUF4434 domain-containing protein [Armatimonadota bacterium]